MKKLVLAFPSFPILETERFILRQINEKDTDEMFELRSNLEVMKYIPRPLAETKNDALNHINMLLENYQKGEIFCWAITEKSKDILIGNVVFIRIQRENFRGEIGYILNPKYHGKGIMQEVVNKIVAFGFKTIGFHTIFAITDPENMGSRKVLEKCGFQLEGHFKQNEFYNGKFLDSVYYAKINQT